MSRFAPTSVLDWLQELACMLQDVQVRVHEHAQGSGGSASLQRWAAFSFKVGASDCFRKNESDRESMLQLFCRVFITLRGSALIMHEYTVPPTSQHFTRGEEREGAELQSDKE